MFDINLDPFETIGEAIGAVRDVVARRNEILDSQQESDEELLCAIVDELSEDFMEDVETMSAQKFPDWVFVTLHDFEAGLMQRAYAHFYDHELEDAFTELKAAIVNFTDFLVGSHPLPDSDYHTMFFIDSTGTYNYDYYAEHPDEHEETEAAFDALRGEVVLKYNDLLYTAHQKYLSWE